MNKDLTKKASNYVSTYYTQHFPKNRLFHSYVHTEIVVNACREIGNGYNLAKTDARRLEMAALFHDIGYADDSENHERRSVEIMSAFLKEQGVLQEDIDAIGKIILATKKGQKPEGLLEEIIKDADMSHLGHDDYVMRSDLLRREWQLMENKEYTDKQWYQENIDFLTTHRFYTQVADVQLGKAKQKNLARLIKQLNKLEANELTIASEKTARLIPEKLGRGVETMYRVSLRNHNSLSRIADNKASIMLSINAIMISVILSSLIPKLDNNPNLLIPTFILVGVCLIAITFAILSARPNYSVSEFDKDAFLKKKFNVLFFGNFHSMKLDEFEWALEELMRDEELLYSSLSKDLYWLGKVMIKKYKLLRTCYNVFMYGIIIAAIAFVIAIQAGNPAVTINPGQLIN